MGERLADQLRKTKKKENLTKKRAAMTQPHGLTNKDIVCETRIRGKE